jgi:hypothetical protein
MRTITIFITVLLLTSVAGLFFIQTSVANQPPNEPFNPNPDDGSMDVSIDTHLRWEGGDPDPGDTVTYDVYFGTSDPLNQVANNQSEDSYEPDTLGYDTVYYWRIVAWDNHDASAQGPIWSFTTQDQIEYNLTLTSSGTGIGTIEANASGPFYYGAKVRIWANASVGSTFTGFSGGLSGTTSPQDLIIQGDTSVDAEFTLDGPYTLSLSSSGSG